jgi:GH43 family beta-xylosidase
MLVWRGKIYMAYSASATDANYCLGLLTADADANLLDVKSWSKSKEPVFGSCDETSQYGPGHNSFTTTPDGSKVIMVYHARNYKIVKGEPLHNPDRAVRAQELKWTEDGLPIFSFPVKDGLYSIGY